MTAEKLHDAIGLLPSDLIEEADRRRQKGPRPILWKRYAAMAACFLLVACCTWLTTRMMASGRATESAVKYEAAAPAAAAPAEDPSFQEAPAEDIPANGASGGTRAEEAPAMDTAEPEAIHSDTTETTSEFCVHSVPTPLKPSTACFGSASQVTLVTSRTELETYLADKDWIYDFTNVQEVCIAFDEAWFEDHDLLLLAVHAAYTDVPYTVTSIENTGGTDSKGCDWYVVYTTPGEGHPEGETTCFHLLTELEKGLISPEDSILTIADPIY